MKDTRLVQLTNLTKNLLVEFAKEMAEAGDEADRQTFRELLNNAEKMHMSLKGLQDAAHK